MYYDENVMKREREKFSFGNLLKSATIVDDLQMCLCVDIETSFLSCASLL